MTGIEILAFLFVGFLGCQRFSGIGDQFGAGGHATPTFNLRVDATYGHGQNGNFQMRTSVRFGR